MSYHKNITPILGYHKVGSGWEVGITTTPQRRFERQMTWLAENVPSCPVTFDDGYESFYTNALPVLQTRGITATVFVITGTVGKLNTWDVNFLGRRFRHLSAAQIREIAASGHRIGSHTVTHRDLTMLSDAEVRQEFSDSKRYLEDMLGTSVPVVSYPFGCVNRRVADLAVACGYTSGYGIRYTALGKMGIGRRIIYRTDTMHSFKRKATVTRYNRDDRLNAFINRCAAGTPVWQQKIVPAITRSIPNRKTREESSWRNASLLKH